MSLGYPNDILFMCQQTVTPLTHFAPLIQLWAGICAICFYDSLVKHLVVTEERKQLRVHLAFFLDKLTDGSSLDERKQALMINKADESLDLFKHRVTHLGRLYCGCAICLLVIAGFETELIYRYVWLWYALGIATVYCIWLVECKKLTFHKRPWSFLYSLVVIYMVVCCGYCESLPQCDIGNGHWVSFIAILLLVFPVIYLVFTYYIEERMTKFRWHQTSSLKNEYDAFVRIQALGGNNFDSEVFSKELKDILAKAPDRDEKQKAFEKYVDRKLNDMFCYGSIAIYRIHSSCLSFKSIFIQELRYFWTTYKESLFIMIIDFAMFFLFLLGIYNFR